MTPEPLLDISDNHIYSYRYGRYFSNGVLVLAIVLILTGLNFFLFNIFEDNFTAILGILLISIGILIFIPSELFQVNFHTKEYRNCFKLFSHYRGEWKTLPKVKYLSIVKQSKTISMSRPSLLGATVDHNVVDCNLRFYIKAGYYVDIDDFNTIEAAIKIGTPIAKGLNIELLDATQRPPVFIEL